MTLGGRSFDIMFARLRVVILIGLLSTLCVDQYFRIELFGYTLRASYAFFGILLTLTAFEHLRSSTNLSSRIFEILSKTSLAGLGLVALSGVIGALFFSPVKDRALAFMIWTLATWISVPIVVFDIRKHLGTLVIRMLAVLVSVISMIVIFDSINCGKFFNFSIGRLILMPEPSTGCRAYAFYQEPNYFAAFTIPAIYALAIFRLQETVENWRRIDDFAVILGIFAVILSSSKMGILSILVLAIYKFYQFIKYPSVKVWLKKNGIKAIAIFSALTAALVLASLTNPFILTTLNYIGRINEISSTFIRLKNGLVVLEIFRVSPWFGSGPGSAGAFIQDQLMNAPALVDYFTYMSADPTVHSQIRREPFFYNFWSELLGEWGLVGLMGFCLYLYGFYKRARLEYRSGILLSFFMISVTWQTIARFDLWLVLMIAFIFSSQNDRQITTQS